MKAVLRRIRISPAKANLVAGMVTGKTVKEALAILKFTPKKAARILYKVVHSAASNAKNNFGQSWDELVITKILVTKGATMKRGLFVSRGRHHPILKRTAHVTVEVGVPGTPAPVKSVPAKSAPAAPKAEKKAPKAPVKKAKTEGKAEKPVKKASKKPASK
ncbi:50S ribosomal protein L22 [Candidatus Peregrinibacteria bacterium]|nr:50S ribosomal protein L22 [Candidatus Peregrinibacteria bacterium]